MKHFFGLLSAFFLFISCQKKTDVPADSGSVNGGVVVSENGLYPFPCHTTTFVTNYPTLPGKVPPFRFTKTLYPSGRVKTINMLSRANPIHSAFKPQAWEVLGTFTYYSNKAVFKGTKQLWEYYKTSPGTAGKRSILKRNVSLTFQFITADEDEENMGYCWRVFNNLKNALALDVG